MGKKILKFLGGMLFILVLVVLIAIGSFIYYLENGMDKGVDEKVQKELFSLINNSPELPPSFYKVYNQYYPDALETGVWKFMFASLKEHPNWLSNRKYICPCAEVYYFPLIRYKSQSRLNHYITALKVEEHCTQKKCLEFILFHGYFGSNIIGIDKAACEFYDKELEELKEQEILELIIIPNAATKYSPKRNRANLDKAVKEMMNSKTTSIP